MQGAIFSNIDVRDYKAVYTAGAVEFPDSFELKMLRIKSQGKVGSCVAHSLSSVIEYYNNKQNGDSTEMSVGYIYGNRTTSNHKGYGMIMRDALEAVRLYGDVYKDSYEVIDNIEIPEAIELFEKNKERLYEEGYTHRISQYCKVNTVSAIKASLMAGNPVLIAMNWYSDMKVVNGILTTKFSGNEGGHCMILYGWNEIGWKIQNSWGKDWGEKGTAIIPYNMKIAESWTVTDDIIEGVVIKKPFSSVVGKKIAKKINYTCNLLKKLNKKRNK